VLTDSTSPHQVRVIGERHDISKLPLEVISDTGERIDFCIDSAGLSILTCDDSFLNALTHLKTKGVRSRFITEIFDNNIYFCNIMMKHGEVFHNENLKGTFIISDGIKYLCYLLDDNGKGQVVTQLFYTKSKSFVDAQQYLFDNLCNKAVPAREKIREIRKGIKGEFIKNVDDPSEIQRIAGDLLSSASYEILLLFSTINSFFRAEYSGILKLLWEASERGVVVKILIQTDDDSMAEEIVQKNIRQKKLPISIQYIKKLLQTKITTLVIDQTISLAIEVNDDTKKNFQEATGVAIYSNNESTVSSCLSIFETLWIQSEFDKQKKVKQAYFKMFKGLDLKNEVYTRRWSFERTENNHTSG
jgi:two-component system, OmpR family, sensor histidine kinase VicK